MKVLIIGANSYVGARLYFDIKKLYDVTGTYAHTPLSKQFVSLDITDSEAVHTVIHDTRPNVIVHVASNANARWCEAHPTEAKAINEHGTRYIAQAADAHNASVIYISSFAAIKPTNVYGFTKYESEKIVKKVQNRYLILRPSFILGFSPNTTNDRPFNRLLKNLDEGTPAIYDTSWKFHPTYVGHISEVIIACLEKNIRNQVIPIAVPEMKTRFDVASDILSPFGITVSPVDKKDATVVITQTFSELTALGLPTYTYTNMIRRIIDEIRNRKQFVL